MHELNRVLPGLGTLMKAVFSPEATGLVAVVFLIEKLVELMGEYKKKMEEAAKATAEVMAAPWHEQQKAVAEAAESAAKFALAIRQINEHTAELAETEERESKVLAEILKTRTALAGEDPAKKADAERRNREDQIKLAEKQHAQTVQALSDAQVQIQQAEQRAKEGAGGPGAAEAAGAAQWLEQHKGDVDKAVQELNEAQRKAGGQTPAQLRAAAQRAFEQGSFGGAERGIAFQELATQLEEATKALPRTMEQFKDMTEIVRRQKEETERLNEAVEKARAKATGLIQTIEKQEEAIKTSTAVNAEEDKRRRALALQGAGLKPEGALGQTVMADIEYLRNLRTLGGRQTPEGQLMIQHLEEALTAHRVPLQAARQLIKEMGDSSKDLGQVLRDVLTALGQLRQQTQGVTITRVTGVPNQ
jgi:hypothetical protein